MTPFFGPQSKFVSKGLLVPPSYYLPTGILEVAAGTLAATRNREKGGNVNADIHP